MYDDQLEIIMEHLESGDLRILIRDCPELSDHEMLAFVMLKFAKCFAMGFPEKITEIKRLMEVIFMQDEKLFN